MARNTGPDTTDKGAARPIDKLHVQDQTQFASGYTCARGPYTVAETAAKLGVSTKTVRRWCERDRSGRTELLSTRTPGGHRRISASEIDSLIKRKLLHTAQAE